MHLEEYRQPSLHVRVVYHFLTGQSQGTGRIDWF